MGGRERLLHGDGSFVQGEQVSDTDVAPAPWRWEDTCELYTWEQLNRQSHTCWYIHMMKI